MAYDHKAWRAEWAKNNKEKLARYRRELRARKRNLLAAENTSPAEKKKLEAEAERIKAYKRGYCLKNVDKESAQRRVHRMLGGKRPILSKTSEYAALVEAFTQLAVLNKEIKNAERQ